MFDLKTHIANPFVKSMRDNVMNKIKNQGLRNACILTVPPVGSGSVLAGTTSGVEPIFALSYLRRSESLSEGEFKVYHPLVSEYMEKFGLDGEADLPDTFVTSHEIEPEMAGPHAGRNPEAHRFMHIKYRESSQGYKS